LIAHVVGTRLHDGAAVRGLLRDSLLAFHRVAVASAFAASARLTFRPPPPRRLSHRGGSDRSPRRSIPERTEVPDVRCNVACLRNDAALRAVMSRRPEDVSALQAIHLQHAANAASASAR